MISRRRRQKNLTSASHVDRWFSPEAALLECPAGRTNGRWPKGKANHTDMYESNKKDI